MLEKLGEGGDALAQHRLGVMYLEGKGAARDPGKAAEWIGKAAEQGQTMSQYMLGRLYLDGVGVKRDSAEAAKSCSRRRRRATRARSI